jgi:hypothetical protein
MPFGLDNAPEALKFWVSFLWFPGREMSVPTDSPVSRRSNLGRSEEFLFGEGSIVIGPRTMAASPLTIRRSVLLECPYIAFYYGGERAHSGVRSSAACDVPVRYVLQTLSHQCVSNVDGVSRSVAAVYDVLRCGLVITRSDTPAPPEPKRTKTKSKIFSQRSKRTTAPWIRPRPSPPRRRRRNSQRLVPSRGSHPAPPPAALSRPHVLPITQIPYLSVSSAKTETPSHARHCGVLLFQRLQDRNRDVGAPKQCLVM